MECFQVIESGEGIEGRILRALSRRGGMTERYAALEHPALLVVSPQAAAEGAELPGACRMLEGLRAASAVSYGSSPRDSLTISSREGDRLWAALQRELVTLGGQVVERQEFPLPLGPDGRAMSDLAVAGALLLLGVPPEELEGEDWGERL